MTQFAYGPPRDAYLNVKEAAKEPWRGITSWIQGEPWLIIDKTDDVYVLENMNGQSFTTDVLPQWSSATEHSALVAASRLEDSPFAAGRKAGNQEIGNLIYFEGEWDVRLADLDIALPIESLVEAYDKIRWSKTAKPWDRPYQVPQGPLDAGMDYRCPNCGSRDVGWTDLQDEMHCDDCGTTGDPIDFEDEAPDFDSTHDHTDDGFYEGSVKTAASFDYPLPPAGIHMRTHQAMAQAGLRALVHFPPGLEGMFGPIPETLEVPSSDQSAVMAVMMLDDPEDYTVRVDTPDDPDAVRQIFDQAGGRRSGKTAEVGDQQNEPTVDQRTALVCPKCGSHTLRAFSPMMNTATIVCLTCGNEFERDVHMNPESSVKKAAPLDPNMSAQIVGLMQQIEEAYQRNDTATAQRLHQQMMSLMQNPNQPLMTAGVKEGVGYAPPAPTGVPPQGQSGAQYPTDPASQAQIAALMKQISAAANAGDINSLRIFQQQMEHLLGGNPAYAKVTNENLTDSTPGYWLESMTFEPKVADSVWNDDPYSGAPVSLDDYTQQGLDPTMESDNDGVDYMHCPACDGPGILLGSLGKRIHYLCRNCGMHFNESNDDNAQTNNTQDVGPHREDPYAGQSYASYDDAKEVNENTLKAFKDSSGNPIEAGKFYTLHHPNYKIPDVVKILNLEDGRIEASIASDEHGSFPIHIKHDEAYSLDLYEPHHKSASGWNVLARRNFTAQEQKELIEENMEGKARNFDKLKLDGTHYTIKEEANDPDFLLGF